MSKKSRFREIFDKQYGKGAQALWKFASQHLYHIHQSLVRKSSWKKSLLFRCQILLLLVNTLAADEKYPVLNRDNLTIPIQKQLSLKQKTFCQSFAAFLKSTINFEQFEKKMTLITFVFLRFGTPKTQSDKCLKNSVGEDAPTSNMVNVPKHCRNLHHSTLVIFIDHCQVS